MRWKIASLLLVAATGCSTAKTTFMSVNSQGILIEKPDRCVQGVPAMIKVPTHIEIKINQTDFWKIEQLGTSPKKLVPLPASTVRSLAVAEITADKMVMIDPKRPVSGQGEFQITYSEDGKGVVQSINYKAVDETLKNSAALATAALKAFGVPTSIKTGIGDGNSKIVKVDRVIAIQRFLINQYSQTEIEAFVGQYINNCAPTDCHSPTAYAKAL